MHKFIIHATAFLCILIIAMPCTTEAATQPAAQAQPFNVLLVTGDRADGERSVAALTDGLAERIGPVRFTIDQESRGNSSRILHDEQMNWAREFDAVIYSSCYTRTDVADHIDRIIDAHVKHQLPAIILDCGLLFYGQESEEWAHFTGGRTHGVQVKRILTVESLRTTHPVMVNFPRTWQTPETGLFEMVELSHGATSLARAYGVDTGRYHDVAWAHDFQGVRVFASMLGSEPETMTHDVQMNLIASGLLWAADLLDGHGTIVSGYEGSRGLGWISLWDGKTLDGWRASENTESFWVENDRIVVDGPRSHLYYDGPIAGGDFINFEFKSQVYTYPQANSGVFFHTRFQDFGWPRYGYEAQVNATQRDRRKTGSLYAVLDVLDDAPHEDHEWFDYYLHIEGRDIIFKVDGEVVLVFAEPLSREGTIKLDRGTIALQAHDPDSRIYYRNLYIRVWPD